MKKILLLLLLSLMALSSSYSQEDYFYTKTGEWDMIRLPLIYPYEAQYLSNYIKWMIVHNSSSVIVGNVQSLHVDKESGIIVGFAESYTYGQRSHDAEYFIITVSNEEHEKFKSEEEFKARLKELGIEEYHFESVDTYFEEFIDRGRCDWFPEDLYRKPYLRFLDPEWRKKEREKRIKRRKQKRANMQR